MSTETMEKPDGLQEESKKIEWSEQQAAFLDWCVNSQGSCILVAVAGAGKTTVLIEAGQRISGGVAYIAYNRKIVEETKAKLMKLGVDWKKMQANTAHGYGLTAYRKSRPNVRVDEYKVANLLDKHMPEDHPLKVFKSEMQKLISHAKQRVLGVLQPMESFDAWANISDKFDIFDEDDDSSPVPLNDIVQLCIKVLKESNSQLDIIDYDDMIYMPLVHKIRFWKHENIFIDESQDINPARRALVRAMLQKGGRVAAVGDPHQAIYGFTGADSDALDLIAKDFNCINLNLTITYRCPKTVVEFARKWVSHISAAETAPLGKVTRSSMEDFLKRNDLKSGSAVLSRVTKPLVSLAFSMIRKRIPCRIEGRDVANGLKKLITRWKVNTLDALENKLDKYLANETAKLLAKKQEAKLQQVEDAVDTIRVIIDQCRNEKLLMVSDAVAYIDQLFGDDVNDVIVLSTIHKAKGREWKNVFWLDRQGTCPSPWARQEWQQEQEKNLCYVAATRAMESLIELDAPMPNRGGK